jgi:hypothetical protein
MRWKQVKGDDGKYHMVPVDAAARAVSKSAAVHGPIEPYISPIDGTIIQGRTGLREHMKKHDVVLMDDYGTEHWDNSAKSRADHYQGRTSREEKQMRRENINEIINHHEARR